MSAESALLAGRAAIEALMVDTCMVSRPGEGIPSWNEDTGQYETPERVPVYVGPCRLQVRADINSNLVETTAGDRESTYLTATLILPITVPPEGFGSSADIRPDDVATYLTAQDDPTMVDREFNVQGLHHKSQATARRFRVREVIA